MLDKTTSDDEDIFEDDVDRYADELIKQRKGLFAKAHKNIKIAQGRQKKYHDKNRYNCKKVCNNK